MDEPSTGETGCTKKVFITIVLMVLIVAVTAAVLYFTDKLREISMNPIKEANVENCKNFSTCASANCCYWFRYPSTWLNGLTRVDKGSINVQTLQEAQAWTLTKLGSESSCGTPIVILWKEFEGDFYYGKQQNNDHNGAQWDAYIWDSKQNPALLP